MTEQCRLDIRNHLFSQRKINEWNTLFTDYVNASSVKKLKFTNISKRRVIHTRITVGLPIIQMASLSICHVELVVLDSNVVKPCTNTASVLLHICSQCRILDQHTQLPQLFPRSECPRAKVFEVNRAVCSGIHWIPPRPSSTYRLALTSDV